MNESDERENNGTSQSGTSLQTSVEESGNPQIHFDIPLSQEQIHQADTSRALLYSLQNDHLSHFHFLLQQELHFTEQDVFNPHPTCYLQIGLFYPIHADYIDLHGHHVNHVNYSHQWGESDTAHSDLPLSHVGSYDSGPLSQFSNAEMSLGVQHLNNQLETHVPQCQAGYSNYDVGFDPLSFASDCPAQDVHHETLRKTFCIALENTEVEEEEREVVEVVDSSSSASLDTITTAPSDAADGQEPCIDVVYQRYQRTQDETSGQTVCELSGDAEVHMEVELESVESHESDEDDDDNCTVTSFDSQATGTYRTAASEVQECTLEMSDGFSEERIPRVAVAFSSSDYCTGSISAEGLRLNIQQSEILASQTLPKIDESQPTQSPETSRLSDTSSLASDQALDVPRRGLVRQLSSSTQDMRIPEENTEDENQSDSKEEDRHKSDTE